VRSTVFPSTVRGLVYPLLLREVQPDSGDRVGIAMNPEFLREGTAVADFKDAFATVIGVNDPRTEKTLRELYAGLSAPIIVTDIETAEMVKYACNAYHALKVAFGNEIGRIAAAAGIDSHKVMDVFVRDDKLNLSAAYLRPGYAFGGSCLPKDLRALTYRAQKSGCSVPMLNAVLESNEEEINRAVGAVLSLGQKDVGLVGLAFKHGTTDLRESPMVALAERLIDAGCEVRAYDRILARELLIGQNEAYAAAHLSDWRDRLVENVDDLLAQSDVIVLSAYEATVAELLEERHTVVDLQYHPACARTAAKYISLNWHIPANATANSTGKQW
jgi:GDP-mannose 6-dehydrogenase